VCVSAAEYQACAHIGAGMTHLKVNAVKLIKAGPSSRCC